jgi:hypothetical protein
LRIGYAIRCLNVGGWAQEELSARIVWDGVAVAVEEVIPKGRRSILDGEAGFRAAVAPEVVVRGLGILETSVREAVFVEDIAALATIGRFGLTRGRGMRRRVAMSRLDSA